MAVNGKGEKTDNMEKLIAAVDAADASGEIPVLEVELSTGVILSLRPTPKHFIYQVTSRFVPPSVPKVWIEAKQREELNPSDPGFQMAMELYAVEVANAATDVTILRGSQIKHIPEDVMGPDDDEWKDEMQLLGLPLADSKRARYLAWVKGIAAPMDRDIEILLEALGRLTGVAEADVLDAVDKFRRVADGTANSNPAGSGG